VRNKFNLFSGDLNMKNKISGSINLEPIQLLVDRPCPPPPYLIDDFLVEGTTSICTGKPKSGKSTLIRNLMVSVAFGSPFLGRKTKSGGVFYFAFEEHEYFLRQFFVATGKQFPENVRVQTAQVYGDAKQILTDLECEIELYKPRLVVIDPVFKFQKFKDSNDYSEISELLSSFEQIAKKFNTHIMLIHHSRKNATAEVGDNILGSTAWFAGATCAFGIERQNNRGFIVSKQRYGNDFPKTYFEFDKNHCLAKFGTAKDLKEVGLREQIMQFLDEQENPIDAQQIQRELKVNRKDLLDELHTLVEQSEIEKNGLGTRKSPYKFSSNLTDTMGGTELEIQ
jgi:hypothetical protein